MECLQSLWRVLNGNTAIREEGSVLSELKDNRDRILAGIIHFKPPSTDSKTKLESNKDVKGTKLEFVKKASILLNLDELQCLKIFQLYLAVEYKDTPSSFNNALLNVIGQQNLLVKLLHFYFSERLSGINCLSYVLSHYKNEDHPLYAGLRTEVEAMDTSSHAIRKSLLDQLKTILKPDYFHITAEDENMLSGHNIKGLFAAQLKAEITGLLRTLLIYNHHFSHTADSYLEQTRLLFSKLLSSACPMVAGLCVVLQFDGLDMDHIFEHFEKVCTLSVLSSKISVVYVISMSMNYIFVLEIMEFTYVPIYKPI